MQYCRDCRDLNQKDECIGDGHEYACCHFRPKYLPNSSAEINRMIEEYKKEKQCMDELFENEEPGIWAEPPKKQSVYIVSKWTRFRLLFAKKYLGTDTEGDITYVTEMRKLKDVVYITHTWLYKNGNLIKEEKL